MVAVVDSSSSSSPLLSSSPPGSAGKLSMSDSGSATLMSKSMSSADMSALKASCKLEQRAGGKGDVLRSGQRARATSLREAAHRAWPDTHGDM